MNVPHYALGGLFIAFVIPVILYFMKVSRDKYTIRIAEQKATDAAFNQWKIDSIAFVTSFKTEFARCDDPADWYAVFEKWIPELKTLSVQIPSSMSAVKKCEFAAVVDGLCNLKSVDVAMNPDLVIQMLEKLEFLIKSA
jgi:hypothetical protein